MEMPPLSDPVQKLKSDKNNDWLETFDEFLIEAEIQITLFERAREEEPSLLRRFVRYLSPAFDFLIILGEYDKAREIIQQNIDVIEEELQTQEPDATTTAVLCKLAWIYMELEDYQRSAQYARTALHLSDSTLNQEDISVVEIYGDLGFIFSSLDLDEKAILCYTRAISISKNVYGSEHMEVAKYLQRLAALYRKKESLEDAIACQKHALAIMEKNLNSDDPEIGLVLLILASYYEAIGQDEDTIPLILRALSSQEKRIGAEHPFIIRRFMDLGRKFHKMKDIGKTEEYYQRVKKILTQQDNLSVFFMHEEYVEFIQDIGHIEEAKRERERIEEYKQKLPEL